MSTFTGEIITAYGVYDGYVGYNTLKIFLNQLWRLERKNQLKEPGSKVDRDSQLRAFTAEAGLYGHLGKDNANHQVYLKLHISYNFYKVISEQANFCAHHI